MEEPYIFNGWRSVLERSGRDFWRLQSALDAIFGVLGAPRGGLERSGRDFWRLKSAQDAIFGVLGAPRGFGRLGIGFWCVLEVPRGLKCRILACA